MIEASTYTFKIWFTTALTAPVIVIYIDYLSTESLFNNLEEALSFYFMLMLAGLFFSCVTALLFSISIYNLLKIYPHQQFHKILTHTTGFVLVLFTFLIFFAWKHSIINFMSAKLFWTVAGAYLACTALCIHFYQLPQFYTDQQ